MILDDEKIFEDLPPQNEEEVEEPEPTDPEDKKAEKQVESKEISNLTKANKEAETRVEELKKSLRLKREEEKKLKAGELPKEDEKEPTTEEDIASVVKKQLAKKEQEVYEKQVEEEVRKVAQNREEAKELYKTSLELPSTGVPSVDVRVALARVEEMKKMKRGFSQPSFSGGSVTDFTSNHPGRDFESLGYNADQIAWFNKHNISLEQVKRYKDSVADPDYMRRLFRPEPKKK